MIGCADTTGHADKASGDTVADPNAYPCLPPGKSIENASRGDHPGVDVEGVGDPEGNEVAACKNVVSDLIS